MNYAESQCSARSADCNRHDTRAHANAVERKLINCIEVTSKWESTYFEQFIECSDRTINIISRTPISVSGALLHRVVIPMPWHVRWKEGRDQWIQNCFSTNPLFTPKCHSAKYRSSDHFQSVPVHWQRWRENV